MIFIGKSMVSDFEIFPKHPKNQSIDLDMALEHWRLRNTSVKHQQTVRWFWVIYVIPIQEMTLPETILVVPISQIPCKKIRNSLLVNVDIPIDTKRLVRISLYPSKIDLVTDKFTYQYLGKFRPSNWVSQGFFYDRITAENMDPSRIWSTTLAAFSSGMCVGSTVKTMW